MLLQWAHSNVLLEKAYANANLGALIRSLTASRYCVYSNIGI